VTAIRETYWRSWLAVMVGDVVHDRSGRAWSVRKIAVEHGSRDGDGAVCCRVELDGGSEQRIMRVPDATARVELDEGPGHGVAAAGADALDWATALVAERLGGTVIDTPDD
jgi:hypothetical protein